jgi:hypothetical protein
MPSGRKRGPVGPVLRSPLRCRRLFGLKHLLDQAAVDGLILIGPDGICLSRRWTSVLYGRKHSCR